MEAESQLETAISKVSSLEKSKMKLTGELEDVVIEVERVCIKSIKSYIYIYITNNVTVFVFNKLYIIYI